LHLQSAFLSHCSALPSSYTLATSALSEKSIEHEKCKTALPEAEKVLKAVLKELKAAEQLEKKSVEEHMKAVPEVTKTLGVEKEATANFDKAMVAWKEVTWVFMDTKKEKAKAEHELQSMTRGDSRIGFNGFIDVPSEEDHEGYLRMEVWYEKITKPTKEHLKKHKNKSKKRATKRCFGCKLPRCCGCNIVPSWVRCNSHLKRKLGPSRKMVMLCASANIPGKEILACKEQSMPLKDMDVVAPHTIPYPTWRKTPLPEHLKPENTHTKTPSPSNSPTNSPRGSPEPGMSSLFERKQSRRAKDEEVALENEKQQAEAQKKGLDADVDLDGLFEADQEALDFRTIKEEVPYPRVQLMIYTHKSLQVRVCDLIGLVPVAGAAGAGAMDVYCKVWYNDWLIGHTSETRCEYNTFAGEYGVAEWNEGEGECFDFPLFHMYITVRKLKAQAENAKQRAALALAKSRQIAHEAKEAAQNAKKAAEMAKKAGMQLKAQAKAAAKGTQIAIGDGAAGVVDLIGRDLDLFNTVRSSFTAQGTNDYAELDIHPDKYGMFSNEFVEHQWRKLPRMFVDEGQDNEALRHGGHLQFRVSLMRRLVIHVVNIEVSQDAPLHCPW
jgi:hypothetical protein